MEPEQLDSLFNCMAEDFYHFNKTQSFIFDFIKWCNEHRFEGIEFTKNNGTEKTDKKDGSLTLEIALYGTDKEPQILTCELYKYTGHLFITTDSGSPRKLLQHIAFSSQNISYTASGSSYLPDHHLHESENIVACHGRLENGTWHIVGPPQRTIEILTKVFSGWLRNRGYAQDRFERAINTVAEKKKINRSATPR